jgi:phage terminase large subunit GpA-like protein
VTPTTDLPTVPADGHFIKAREWLKRVVKATLRPRPKMRLWEWLEKHFVIPREVDSPKPGPYRTSTFPPMRGLFDLIDQPGVHFFSFCSSARIGKTLLSLGILCWWISERFGTVVWLDPTRKTALRLVRTELEYFLLQCKPVRALAIISKTTWTVLEKSFVGKVFRIVASGAEADMHGYQARLVVINESDRCRQSIDRDAASADKVIARSRQFAHERLIVRNSTPTEEWGDIWVNFKADPTLLLPSVPALQRRCRGEGEGWQAAAETRAHR